MMRMTAFKKILFGIALSVILIAPPFLLALPEIAYAAIPDVVRQECTQRESFYTVKFFVTENADKTYKCTMGGTYITLDESGKEIPGKGGYSSLLAGDKPYAGTNATCSSWGGYFADMGACIGRSLASWLGASLVALTSWLMGVAGLLFNWIISNTIVEFGDIYTSIKSGVESAWTVFRDIANILIIGLFVFIAISIILGLKEFGQKKYVARILVVAVLINFSLLFTKMIVDFSNFTAGQVYTEMQNQIGGAKPNTSLSVLGANERPLGIAGTFLKMTGVKRISQTADDLNKVADSNQSALLALLHGVVIATLFFAVALVFLYGSYILVSRAIIIIVLLMTSALAFGTYIIPNQAIVKQGWDTWWSSLIRCAALAPILMVFLWATANVAANLPQSKTGGTLANLASNTPTFTSIEALLNYAIVLGLLFASFYVASKLSSSIAGFNLPAMITAGTVGAVARYGVSPFLQQTVGRVAARVQGSRSKDIGTARDASAVARGRAEQSRNLQTAALARAQEARGQMVGNKDANLVRALKARAASADVDAKKHAEDAQKQDTEKKRQDDIQAKKAISDIGARTALPSGGGGGGVAGITCAAKGVAGGMVDCEMVRDPASSILLCSLGTEASASSRSNSALIGSNTTRETSSASLRAVASSISRSFLKCSAKSSGSWNPSSVSITSFSNNCHWSRCSLWLSASSRRCFSRSADVIAS